MGPTLFWYVLKDLLRIFALASGALAGIMSFGGLLAPLTKYGLDVSQVAQMLGYLMPAMSAYSLPIAALFATTMVYGRLGADNEILAMRAAGVSHFAITMPAFVLGLVVSIISLVCLCFVVPSMTLKVEKVIYSNLAKVVANQIQRYHNVPFDSGNGNGAQVIIYAQSAQVAAPPVDRPTDQIVQLYGPMIVTYDSTIKTEKRPEQFLLARSATATIRQDPGDGEVTLSAVLDHGYAIPREYRNTRDANMQISIARATYQSAPMPSPVRENTKFMNIWTLYDVLKQPDKSRRIMTPVAQFQRGDQETLFLQKLQNALNNPNASVRIGSGSETYELSRTSGAIMDLRASRLTIGGPDEPPTTQIRLRQLASSPIALDATARQAIVRARVDPRDPIMHVDIEMIDTVVAKGEEASGGPRTSFPRELSVPLTADLAAIPRERNAAHYLRAAKNDPKVAGAPYLSLLRETKRLNNSILSELHARGSFAVSCFVLVVVGCLLGMMFKSGNFLSAFAVSVVPALLSIVLIVTGQHTAENVPWTIGPNFKDPLSLGIALIWSGNAVVATIGVMLLLRLNRE